MGTESKSSNGGDGFAAGTNTSLEESLNILLEASGRLVGSVCTEEILPEILGLSRRLIAADAYAVWRLRAGTRAWEIVRAHGLSERYCEVAFESLSGNSALAEAAVQFEDVEAAPVQPERKALYRSEGVRSLLAVPLRIGGRVSGTITFYFRRARRFEERELRAAEALANLSAAALSAAEAFAEQERSRRAADFLAEAGRLLASSLDYQTTLASVARLAVPHIADWSSVDLLDEHGNLEPVALAHNDPGRIQWARELQRRYPPRADAAGGPAKVVRTGEPELLSEIPDSLLVAEAVDAEHLRILREVGFTSYMCVPMKARGRTLGAITLVSAESGRRYGRADLDLAAGLADRAALAVDNARLYARAQREREAARAALAALQESETRFRTVVESDLIGVGFADPAGRLTYANDALLRLLGRTRADLLAGTLCWEQALPAEFREAGERAFEQARAQGVCAAYETELARPDGSRMPVLMGCARVDAGGGTVAFALDLSQRRRAEREFRESSERLKLALQAGRMAIWDWDLRHGTIDWSEHLQPEAGVTAGLFRGSFEDVLLAVHAEDRAGLHAALDRALADPGGRFESEFRVPGGDGEDHWIMGLGQVFRDASGAAVRMLGISMDVTARKQLDEKLRLAQKLESVGLLAGGIAHDFNNLLTGILGHASLAMEVVPEGSPAQPLLDDVVLASERAADLTRQLLAYSGKGSFLIERLDLSVLVRQISSLLLVSIPKRVQLRLELNPGLPPVEADSSQVQQVIMNLVINGAEAVGEQDGSVVVRTGVEELDARAIRAEFAHEEPAPGQYVFLEVADTGCGMDAVTRSRIFDPFFTTKFTGRGLGLAAVSGILRSHRGAIRVASTPGGGSTFRALFPAATGAAGPRPAVERPAGRLESSGVVLVIDDEEVVRRTAETALRRFGYTVLLAQNGAEGVALFEQRKLDIQAVVLDVTMPVMDGQEAIAHLKRIRPEVPVIASSGYSEMEALPRFQARDLAGFIQKPYTAADLAAKLKAVLGAGRAPAR